MAYVPLTEVGQRFFQRLNALSICSLNLMANKGNSGALLNWTTTRFTATVLNRLLHRSNVVNPRSQLPYSQETPRILALVNANSTTLNEDALLNSLLHAELF